MKIAIIGAGISGLTLANLIYLNKSQEIYFNVIKFLEYKECRLL